MNRSFEMDETRLSGTTDESNAMNTEPRTDLDEQAEPRGDAFDSTGSAHEPTIAAGVRAKGSIKGRLEKLNVHNRNEFTLVPPVGEPAIACSFKEALFDKVKLAIKRNVLVHGILFYGEGKAYPERIQVDDLEILPPDAELPTLGSLRGIMPNATNGKPVLEFVLGIRDD